MKRVIKFRALSHSGEWFISGSGVDDLSVFFGSIDGMANHKIETITQFTGIKDKNDVEIYEGDIVVDHAFPEKGTVRHLIDAPYMQDRDGYKHSNFEVIGNIYENPELLKGDI